MAAPKFADLPGIVWNEPEVYETSNTPEGHQAELEALPAAAAEELAKCRTEAPVKSPAKALTSIGDMVTFEVYWRPGQDQFALDAKIVELEKRLAQLEATVQCKPISQETAQILQAKVNILDEVMLDQIEARLKSILGKVKEIAEHEATLQCANSQSKVRANRVDPSKSNPAGVRRLFGALLQTVLTPTFLAFHPLLQIHQTYELMQHWDPIASSLPDVVQYLLTLRDLHKEGEGLEGMLGTAAWHDRGLLWRLLLLMSFCLPPATQVGQVLEDMETMQKEIADALQVNTFLLEVVSPTSICWTWTWA
uniref:Uncharacterized protein n=1 Tax=Anser cygnoides TaxID=8845 RepID=A0A8B9DVK0_ANSCY